MSSNKYLQYAQSKPPCLIWIQLSYAVKNVVEMIMMPPQQIDEYLLKNPIYHVLFKQWRFFGNDFLCSMQSIFQNAIYIKWTFGMLRVYAQQIIYQQLQALLCHTHLAIYLQK
ncbi:Hypothetical_protein [Hexamita inflata]|uniref:Hypothetical_protein n=1 Tax=Hexamita inflata TaxID=28002 RepID=A0AA86TYE6_9EUKA|nr:Hypothetical protein HINF_LOCUS19412 [Hexamita inflata]